MNTVTWFLLVICCKIHVLNVITIAKFVFSKWAANKNFINVNGKPRRLQKTIAILAGVKQKTISKVILKYYKEPLSIERKGGSGRKK